MGRRLLFGSKSALARLGIVDGREIFPILGAEDDHLANSGEGSEDDNDSDEDQDDDDSEEDDDSKTAAKKRHRSPSTQRNSELRAARRELSTLRKEKAERDKAARDAELKGKSESERAVAERDDAVKELTGLKDRYQQAITELEIIKASNRSKFAWNDIEDVLNDRALRNAIEIGDDGEVSGLEDALKDLAKRKPHFLAEKSDDKGKGNGQQQNGNGRQQQQTGTKTGGQPNTGTNEDRAADRQRLNTIYPALQRLQ